MVPRPIDVRRTWDWSSEMFRITVLMNVPSLDSTWLRPTTQTTDHTRDIRHTTDWEMFNEKTKAGILRRRHGHRHRLAKHGYTLTSDIRYFLASIVARMSACHSACYRNNFRKSRVSDVSARILARMSVSASWNSSWSSHTTCRCSPMPAAAAAAHGRSRGRGRGTLH